MMANKQRNRTQANAKKRRRNSKAAKRQVVVVVACLITMCFCISTLIPQAFSYVESKQKLTEQQLAYEEAKNQQAALEIELKKAEDPNYIQQYAREKYFLSHEGEILLVLPEAPKITDPVEQSGFWEQFLDIFRQETEGE